MNCQLVTVNHKVPPCVPHLGCSITIATHSLNVLWPFLKQEFPPPWTQSQSLHPPKELTLHMPFWGCFNPLLLFLLISRSITLRLMPDPYSTSFSATGEGPSAPNWRRQATLASSLMGFHVGHPRQLLLLDVALAEPDPELPAQPSRRQGAGRAAERPAGKPPPPAAPAMPFRGCAVPCQLVLRVGRARRCPVLAVIPTALRRDAAGEAPGSLPGIAGGPVAAALAGWVGWVGRGCHDSVTDRGPEDWDQRLNSFLLPSLDKPEEKAAETDTVSGQHPLGPGRHLALADEDEFTFWVDRALTSCHECLTDEHQSCTGREVHYK